MTDTVSKIKPDDIILLEINEQNLSDEAVAHIKTKLWDILDKAIDKQYSIDKQYRDNK